MPTTPYQLILFNSKGGVVVLGKRVFDKSSSSKRRSDIKDDSSSRRFLWKDMLGRFYGHESKLLGKHVTKPWVAVLQSLSFNTSSPLKFTFEFAVQSSPDPCMRCSHSSSCVSMYQKDKHEEIDGETMDYICTSPVVSFSPLWVEEDMLSFKCPLVPFVCFRI